MKKQKEKNRLAEQILVLSSNCWFFDILGNFKNLQLNIPECVLFDNCFPKSWFFTSAKKDGMILRKKREKINYQYIQKGFAPRVTTLLSYQENGSKHPIKGDQFQQMLQEPKAFMNISLLQLQKSVNLTTLFFVTYKRANQLLPFKIKVFKFNNKCEYNFVYSKELKAECIRSNDDKQNQQFGETLAKAVTAIERSYNFLIRVYKTTFCFVVQEDLSLYLIGIMKIRVKLIKQILKNQKTNQMEASLFFDQLLPHITDPKETQEPLPAIIDNTQQRFSQKLFKVLKKDVCSGDFCEFILIDENRQSMVIRKKIIKDFQKTQSQLSQLGHTRVLNDEISNDLIFKCRSRAKEVIEILKKNKVFQITSSLHYQDDLICNDKEEFPILLKQGMSIRDRSDKYKFQKICGNCLTVYSLLQKKLLQNDKQPPDKLYEVTPDQSIGSKFNSYLQNEQEDGKFQRSIPQRLTISYNEENDYQPQFSSVRERRSITPKKRQSTKKTLLLNVLESYRIQKERDKIEKLEKAMNVSTQKMESSRMHLGVLSFSSKTMSLKAKEYQLASLELPGIQAGFYRPVNLYQIFGITNKNLLRRLTTFIQAKSEKERQKRKQRVTELQINKQQLRELIANDVRQTQQETPKFIIFELSSSHYYFTNRFKHIRQLPKYKMDSPMQAMEHQQIVKLRDFPFYRFKEFSNYPYTHSVFHSVVDQIQYYIHDAFLAVPYLLFNSYQTSDEQTLLIFIQDIFDSFTEFISLFQTIITHSENIQILLFNLPGQAFTFYEKKKFLDAFNLCEIIDGLLFHVAEDQVKMPGSSKGWSPAIKIIGLGLGGFIAQSYCLVANATSLKINQLLLVNSIQRVDAQLKQNLDQFDDVIKNSPDHLSELPYSYYSILYNSPALTEEKIEQKMLCNPIFKEGRRVLIEGIQKSHDMKAQQIRQLNLDILFVQSLNNNFTEDQSYNYRQTEPWEQNQKNSLCELNEESTKQSQSNKNLVDKGKLIIFEKKKKFRRIEYIEGAYAFWESNQEFLKKIILRFLDDSWIE